ncbi:cation:proton antiporter [Staphylothermus hellenicus]|uniref:Sodium/hydrogen exchanger n=1 Tax=Staphylothermus hellenicus (strain DSM 12710 / JCM 10830 / BK20S6-10-b1 / P8) TaxID=591019 RepID=D7D8M8_STAHD|nr:cation:proton antiporter [Staphylothermus hellenicus]ADI32124.1 sodium/hydrogen exchanger [Staphylothermus hellenicus DSM 12710]
MIAEADAAELLLILSIIIIVAKLLEELISYYGYPPILGDILAGIILGPSVLGLITPEIIDYLDVIKWIGIISLLFLAGLETKFTQFMRSIRSSLLVAAGGIIGSFILGYLAGILAGLNSAQSIFLGTILTATSVGLTVKTLTDVGALGTMYFTVILGAAVLDDVGGLIVFGLAKATVTTGTAMIEELFLTAIIAISFYIITLFLLHKSSRFIWGLMRHISRLEDSIIAFLLGLTLIIAWATVEVNLSLVVGAYLVGLAFSEVKGVENVMRRFSLIPNIFASIFFVLSAASIDIKPYVTHIEYLGFIGIVLVAAFAGKILGCGLAAKLDKLDWKSSLFIGVGMLPRAEVALVVSALGKGYGVVTDSMIAATIFVIYVTSIVTPILLTSLWKRMATK